MSRPRTADALVCALLTEMREAVVRPGTNLLTESELAARHGVSRTVVREAITALQAAGIVRTHQGRGSFVHAAIAAGDPLAAGAAMRTHLTGSARRLDHAAAASPNAEKH